MLEIREQRFIINKGVVFVGSKYMNEYMSLFIVDYNIE